MRAGQSTELVAVYSSRNAEDKLAFELLQRTFPSCVSIPIDSERHKIFGYFHHVGLLPLFLACLLDYWDEADIRTDCSLDCNSPPAMS